jgi:hypothetical protein
MEDRIEYKGYSIVRHIAEDNTWVSYTVFDSDGNEVDSDCSSDPEEFSFDSIKKMLDGSGITDEGDLVRPGYICCHMCGIITTHHQGNHCNGCATATL